VSARQVDATVTRCDTVTKFIDHLRSRVYTKFYFRYFTLGGPQDFGQGWSCVHVRSMQLSLDVTPSPSSSTTFGLVYTPSFTYATSLPGVHRPRDFGQGWSCAHVRSIQLSLDVTPPPSSSTTFSLVYTQVLLSLLQCHWQWQSPGTPGGVHRPRDYSQKSSCFSEDDARADKVQSLSCAAISRKRPAFFATSLFREASRPLVRCSRRRSRPRSRGRPCPMWPTSVHFQARVLSAGVLCWCPEFTVARVGGTLV
jgi:hypothetical protein